MEKLENDQISSNIITTLKMSTVVVILLLRRKIILRLRVFWVLNGIQRDPLCRDQ